MHILKAASGVVEIATLMSSPATVYRVTTPRLVLRCFAPTDAPLVSRAIEASLEHLRTFLPWARAEPLSLDERVGLLRQFRGEFDLDRDQTFGLFSPDERELVGGAGLHLRVGPHAREIGYWVRADVTRRGYATEAVAALTQIALLAQGAHRLEIHCDPRNVASSGVPRKLGFVHEATRRRVVDVDAARAADRMIWTLLDDELPSSPAMAVPVEAFDVLGRRVL